MLPMRMVLLFALVLAACEHGKGGFAVGGSGVAGDRQVGELDAGEIDRLCAYLLSIAPTPRTVTCPDGDSVEIEETSRAECVMVLSDPEGSFATCTITVDEYETCVEAIVARSDAEICDNAFPPECEPLLDCATTDEPTDPPPPPEPGS